MRLPPAQALTAPGVGGLILDTRQYTDRWSDGVIAGSVHAPRTVLGWIVDPVSGFQHPLVEGLDQVLIVMCNEDYSSSLAAHTLQRLDFRNATDMVGGFTGWRAAGLPVRGARPHEPARARRARAARASGRTHPRRHRMNPTDAITRRAPLGRGAIATAGLIGEASLLAACGSDSTAARARPRRPSSPGR